MKPQILACLLLFSSILTQAQKNFQPAYIVKSSGDTVKGFIDYRQWEENPRFIFFKSSEMESADRYTTAMVKSFEITGKDSYQKFVIWKDALSVNVGSLSKLGEEKNVRDTVWLRTLVLHPQISLYELVDEKQHFYFQQGTAEPMELLYKVMLTSASTFKSYPIYRDQLKTLVSGDKNLEREIDQSNYQASDLVKIIHNLNGTVLPGIQKSTNKNKGFRYFAGGGVVLNSFSTSLGDASFRYPPQFVTLNLLKYSGNPGYILSAGVDLFPSRSNDRFFVRGSINYSNISQEGTYVGKDIYNDDRVDNYHYAVSTFSPAISLLCNLYNKPSVALFGGAGIALNFSSYTKNTMVTNGGTYNEFLVFENPWAFFDLKAGLRLKNYEVGFSTKIQGESNRTWGVKVKTNYSTFTVSYIFN